MNFLTHFDVPLDPLVRELALCRKEGDLAWFFPTPENISDAKLAVAICERCQVKGACLTEALKCGPHLCGIWGGTSQRQRARIRRRRPPQQKGK